MVKNVWLIFRCRVCGQKIAKFSEYSHQSVLGCLTSNQLHRHCTDLQDGEQAFVDLIKISDNACPEAVDYLASVEHGKYAQGYYPNVSVVHLDDFGEFWSTHDVTTKLSDLPDMFSSQVKTMV